MIHQPSRAHASVGMTQTVLVLHPAADRERLLAVVADRNRLFEHVRRAQIILRSAKRLPAPEVARRAGVSRPAVWRRQALRRARRRRPLVRQDPQAQTSAAFSRGRPKNLKRSVPSLRPKPPIRPTAPIANAFGVNVRAVKRPWEAHRLQRRRLRAFERFNDFEFAKKVEDIAGLHRDPPKHAVVVEIDEKSQIQALDRPQPSLPRKHGKCGTTTRDRQSNGATSCSPPSTSSTER